MKKSFHQSGITAHGEIVIDALRIDTPVGAENKPLLFFVEGDFRFINDLLLGAGIGIE